PMLAGPSDAPDLNALLAQRESELLSVVMQYRGGGFGRGGGGRPANTDRDPTRWLDGLKKLPFDTLTRPAQIDYILLRTALEHDLKRQQARDKKTDRPPTPKDDTGIIGRPIGRDALMVE